MRFTPHSPSTQILTVALGLSIVFMAGRCGPITPSGYKHDAGADIPQAQLTDRGNPSTPQELTLDKFKAEVVGSLERAQLASHAISLSQAELSQLKSSARSVVLPLSAEQVTKAKKEGLHITLEVDGSSQSASPSAISLLSSSGKLLLAVKAGKAGDELISKLKSVSLTIGTPEPEAEPEAEPEEEVLMSLSLEPILSVGK